MTEEVTVVNNHPKCGTKWGEDYIPNLPLMRWASLARIHRVQSTKKIHKTKPGKPVFPGERL